MAFLRHGTPSNMKVITLCDECKQDRPLIKVTQGGVTKNLCGSCVKPWVKRLNGNNSDGVQK